MCGILGISPSFEKERFKKALDLLTHRGPDGSGVWSDENITLGHRRLSIIDLSDNAEQPMQFNEYVITYNGEIYNFIELKNELIELGYSFSSKSDTEVLLKSYIHWGPKCLEKLNGMWALAIWNTKTEELFLSRDRFGKKPLFYSFDNEKFIFASEMKAITPFMKNVEISDSFEECNKSMFHYESSDNTLIKNIFRIKAGSYAIWKKGERTLNEISFWNTLDNIKPIKGTYEEKVSQFRNLFLDACRIRMRSDVPLGTALSGGIDSSATICSMAYINKAQNGDDINQSWQHAFVATFEGTFLDESEYAKAVLKHIEVEGTFEEINSSKSFEKLTEYLYLFEEVYNTSPVPMIDLYRKIKEGNVTVTLDGHGADELICGYGPDIYKMFRDDPLNFNRNKSIHDIFYNLNDLDTSQISSISKNITLNIIFNKFFGGFKGIVKDILGFLGIYKYKEYQYSKKLGFFNSYLYHLTHDTILPTLLRNYDRYSMAASVEVRMPFMDHRVVTFLLGLDADSKNRQGKTKSIIRDALKDIMPGKILNRTSKIGFNSPIVDWIQGSWKDDLIKLGESELMKESKLIDQNYYNSKLQNILNSKNVSFNEGMELWKILTPFLWELSFFNRVKEFKV